MGKGSIAVHQFTDAEMLSTDLDRPGRIDFIVDKKELDILSKTGESVRFSDKTGVSQMISDAISGIHLPAGFEFKDVTELPATGEVGYIYLLPSGVMWGWDNDHFVQINGITDLSGYYKKEDVDSKDASTLSSANRYTDNAISSIGDETDPVAMQALQTKSDIYESAGVYSDKHLSEVIVGDILSGCTVTFPTSGGISYGNGKYIQFLDGTYFGCGTGGWGLFNSDDTAIELVTSSDGGNHYINPTYTFPAGKIVAKIIMDTLHSTMTGSTVADVASGAIYANCETNYQRQIIDAANLLHHQLTDIGRWNMSYSDRLRLYELEALIQGLVLGGTSSTFINRPAGQTPIGGTYTATNPEGGILEFTAQNTDKQYAQLTLNGTVVWTNDGILDGQPIDFIWRLNANDVATLTTCMKAKYTAFVQTPDRFALLSELTAHIENDKGYWATLLEVQNKVTANQALLMQQQTQINDLLVRIATLESAPVPTIPTYDMTNPVILHTPALIGALGLEIGSTGPLVSGSWTAPADGKVVIDGAAAVGLLTTTWIAVNGNKVAPDSSLAVLTLIGGGNSGEFIVKAGDVLTQSGMGNVTYYGVVS